VNGLFKKRGLFLEKRPQKNLILLEAVSFFGAFFPKKGRFSKKSSFWALFLKGHSRMAKTRKVSKGIASRVSAPVNHAVRAVANTANVGIKLAGKFVKGTIKGARKVGSIVVRHFNSAVKNVTKKGQKGGRRGRGRSGRGKRSRSRK